MPAFDQIKPGFFKLDGQNYVASDIRTCAAGGTQGELPFVADGGWQAKVADFRSLDAFLTLDYSDGPDPELYIGRAFALSDMQAASLRNADQVRETAGRFRGQIKALDCPNCGGSISFVAAMATQVVPVLRFDRGLRRREGRGHREGAQAQVHQDHAGAGRDGQHRRRRLQSDRPDEMRGPGSRGAVAMDRIPDVQPGPGLSVAGRDR